MDDETNYRWNEFEIDLKNPSCSYDRNRMVDLVHQHTNLPKANQRSAINNDL
jgi:hypothetical protein